ncbi:MAG: HAD family hydrolase, partial [Candidatus Binatia bacterium]
MLRAVIFDFNGIIVDDEPIHFELFQKVLYEEGVALTKEDYYARYLGMDDRGCFTAAYRNAGREIAEPHLAPLIKRKAAYYLDAIQKTMRVFPGVNALVPELARQFPLAIASGALRNEIELILSAVSLRDHFQTIVSAEDVKEGKPEPEIFLKTLSRLNAQLRDGAPINARECLVIEDSKEGIRGAKKAGMRCLAVTNSHPPEDL